MQTHSLSLHKAAMSDRSIGALLIDAGKLKIEDAENVLRLQREEGLLFGDAALRLGLLTEDDIQRALARQYNYPYLLADDRGLVSAELIAAYQPFGSKVESLRALRTQLMLRWFTGQPERHALAVVSANPGDGRSYLAANLAIVFSQLGEKTLLIDADMRCGRQHALFKLDNRLGLSSILSGRADQGVIGRISHFVDLSVLTAGPCPPNPQELLGRASLTELFNALKSQYDVIIIDTPAANDGADAEMVAVRAGAALVVTRIDQTPIKQVEKLASNLMQLGTRIVGSVLNDY